MAALSPDAARLATVVERARRAHQDLPGVEVIWRQDCYQLPTGRTSFGFKDGIGQYGDSLWRRLTPLRFPSHSG